MTDYRSIALVVESWEDARLKPDFEEQVSSKILQNLFDLAPRTRQAFGVRRNLEPTLDNLKRTPALQHIARMLKFLNLILTLQGPPEILYQVLEDCGRRHAKYSCHAQTISIMGKAILLSLKDWLGAESWGDQTQEAWEKIFNVIENRMVKGLTTK